MRRTVWAVPAVLAVLALGAGGAGGAGGARGAALVRSVERTATITVTVADVAAAAHAATDAVERVGGYVESEDTRLAAQSTLTLRVPPERFTSLGDELARLGSLVERRAGAGHVGFGGAGAFGAVGG